VDAELAQEGEPGVQASAAQQSGGGDVAGIAERLARQYRAEEIVVGVGDAGGDAGEIEQHFVGGQGAAVECQGVEERFERAAGGAAGGEEVERGARGVRQGGDGGEDFAGAALDHHQGGLLGAEIMQIQHLSGGEGGELGLQAQVDRSVQDGDIRRVWCAGAGGQA